MGFRDISTGHNQVTGAIDLQGVSFFHLDYVSCSDIKGTSPSSTSTGICIELDGIGSPTPGYTQWGTITQLSAQDIKYGVQTNHKTSAIVMLGGEISCAVTSNSYITGSIGLDFGYTNHSDSTSGQNGEHWIGGVSINDCNYGGAFYNTAASRISLKLEQNTPNTNTGTALMLDGTHGAGLTYDNELHIFASKTDRGVALGMNDYGVQNTSIAGYASGGINTADIVISNTGTVLASTHIATPKALKTSTISGATTIPGNQFPGPINLPDLSTPSVNPATGTATLFVNNGSTPPDDLTVLHNSGTTVDLETHGITNQGDVLVANSSTPAELAPLSLPSGGGANRYLKSNGTTVLYSTNPAGGSGACSSGQFETTSNADSAPTCADPNLIGWQDPAAAISGNSPSDVTLYTTTLPAVPQGHGIRATVYFQLTTGSASVTYKWKFGGGTPVSLSYATASNHFMSASAVVFNSPSSSSSQTLAASTLLTGTGQVDGGQVPDTENWGSTSTLTISFAFNASSSDKVTPEGWLVELIQ